jgi:hypothetical protein
VGRLFLAALVAVLMLTSGMAWAQSSCAGVEALYVKALNDLYGQYRRSAECQKDKALLGYVNGQLSALATDQNMQLIDDQAIKIRAEVKHDHEEFIFGSRYYLRVNIRNNSSMDYFIDPSEVVVHVPSELIIDKKHGGDITRFCTALHGPTEAFNGQQALRIPRDSDYVMVWDCPPEDEYFFSGFIRKLSFRPDQYTFVVNVPLRFKYRDPILMKAGATASVGNEYGVVTKISEAAVGADLDGFFVSVCSIFGAAIAVMSRACLLLVENYSLRKLDWPHKFSFEIRKVLVDSGLFLVVASTLTPLLIAGANVTQKFDHGVSIKIFDFFGAALAGFVVQMLIMKLGQPAIDKMLSHQA